MWIWRVLVSAVEVMWLVSSCAGPATSCFFCEDQWAATGHPLHFGCWAGPVNPGGVIDGPAEVYAYHEATWQRATDIDVDCHRLLDCSFEDAADQTVSCEWKLLTAQGDVLISSTCGSAIWSNTCDYEPERTYTIRVAVDDDPDDPERDDAVQYLYDTVTLRQQLMTNFRVDTYACTGGYLFVDYVTDSTCGHSGHLERVTCREYVTYESEFTEGGTHFTSHWGANCFTGSLDDPYYMDGGPGSGVLWDQHLCFEAATPYEESLCTTYQTYQQAWKWPNRPSEHDTTVTWLDLSSHTIARTVVYEDGVWKQYVTKGSLNCENIIE